MPDPLCRSPRLVNSSGDTREASACRGDFAPEPASRTRPVCATLLFVRRGTLLTRLLSAEEDPVEQWPEDRGPFLGAACSKRLLVGAGAPGSGWSRLPGDSLRCVSCFPRDPLPGSASCFNCFSAGELLTFSSEWFLAGVWLAAANGFSAGECLFSPKRGASGRGVCVRRGMPLDSRPR